MSETIKPLVLADVMPNSVYLARRKEFREQALAYRADRTIALGPNLSLSFENRHTVRYQLQEMLAEENIESPEAIATALAAYNALIPRGSEWRAGCFVTAEGKGKAKVLERLRGAARGVWLAVAQMPRIAAQADDEGDEDAVQLLRFPLDALQVTMLKAGAPVALGVEHGDYRYKVLVPDAMRASLASDLLSPV